MSREGGPADGNIFVRFRQHVDSHISSGLNTLLGYSPSAPRRAIPDVSSSSPLDFPTRPETSFPMGTIQGREPGGRSFLDIFSSEYYSPLALRHLPQPIPNDLPPGIDSSVFTYKDAFEDLLAAAQGIPMLGLETRYEQSRLLNQMFPRGEPPIFWARRLESQGLIQFPMNARRQLDQPNWEFFRDELRRNADSVWRPYDSDLEETPDFRKTVDLCRDHLGDYIHEMRKEIEQLTNEARNRFVPPGVFPRETQNEDAKEESQRALPDTFNDLFSAVTTAFAEGQKTWDTFIKTIATPPSSSGSVQDEQASQGTKRVETRDEYTDRLGYHHTTITRKILDEQGREIGRETSVVVRPAERQQKSDDRSTREAEAGNRNDKNPGWFWK
ncbi:hypothetical protein HIM_07176 [Hirsutella minnesotensis 3608]|uniref:Uncharacterized protein n=1 Tax=Hirsutella minnesotensis 3608 TaxID=1043627 RepID=A0A0F7ZZ05_9HYPO|nr:hypothetical protein HIM_07176 [Hirsutella minnesotensis 3608]